MFAVRNVSSCLCFCSFSVLPVYLVVSDRFQLCRAFNRAFLCESVRVCLCGRVFVCAACPLARAPWACRSAKALDMLLAGNAVCGFCFWSWCSGGRKRCVPPKPPATRPPSLSSAEQPLSLLSLLSFSWAPESGLWPVDECYILAVSTGVSWGLACGGSAVSGPVCQLLVPLPPTPQRRLQSVAQTYVEL